jgi:predicted DCC family thiol-disulfide oxidoreductase YuxK
MSEAIPSPDERPGADVIIYDGQCPLCLAMVTRLTEWDRWRRLAYIPLQNPMVTQRWPRLDREQLMKEVYLISSQGHIYRGAEVLRVLTRRIPRLWPLVPLVHLPGTLPFWQWLYHAISRRRYLFGPRSACAPGTCHWHQK